jgi:hypothetical protein
MSRRSALALTVALLGIAGCGGDGSAPSPSGAAPAASGGAPAAQVDAQPGAAKQHGEGRRSEPSSAASARDGVSGDDGPEQARQRRAADTDAANRTGADAANPCTLVTRAEAAAIIGGRVGAPQLGVQGPTCIYQSRAPERLVTLAVAQMDHAKLTAGAHAVADVSVGGRKAVCVTAGQQLLRVPLVEGRVLNVAAPCPIATGFARTALRRILG